MQTLREIRELLQRYHFAPQKQFGQCFLVDGNLMHKLLDLAQVGREQTVLEVGPGTGSLTEELLDRCGRLVAVEIDRGLADLLRERLGGQESFTLLCRDVLASKHAIAPEVTAAVSPSAHLVSNLPYNVATPLIAQCLTDTWRTCVGEVAGICRFERLTFTVQREVADRLACGPGGPDYGPLSILVSLLGELTPGPVVPASAFWPRPNVASRIVRIDFVDDKARRVADLDVLRRLLALAFNQRRKQIGSLLHRTIADFSPQRIQRALEAGGIDRTARAQDLRPEQFRLAANDLVS